MVDEGGQKGQMSKAWSAAPDFTSEIHPGGVRVRAKTVLGVSARLSSLNVLFVGNRST